MGYGAGIGAQPASPATRSPENQRLLSHKARERLTSPAN